MCLCKYAMHPSLNEPEIDRKKEGGQKKDGGMEEDTWRRIHTMVIHLSHVSNPVAIGPITLPVHSTYGELRRRFIFISDPI